MNRLVDYKYTNMNSTKCGNSSITYKELANIITTYFPDYQASPILTIDLRQPDDVRRIMKLANFFVLPKNSEI